MQNIHLLVIDPQNDFCDPKGSLFVPGADNDMKRLADLVNRMGRKIDDIHVTLDSHHRLQIFHPLWWKDSKGNCPNPFTMISAKDVENGTWTTSVPSLYKRSLDYVKQLESQGKYTLCIWPEHTLIGSAGHNVVQPLYDALSAWEKEFTAVINFLTKGSNLFTESYSALKSEVVDPNDPTTQINTNFIKTLLDADEIVIAGEAQSHCVYWTIKDVADQFGNDDYVKKFVILADCMSPVPGFEKNATNFFDEMKKRGAIITESSKYLI